MMNIILCIPFGILTYIQKENQGTLNFTRQDAELMIHECRNRKVPIDIEHSLINISSCKPIGYIEKIYLSKKGLHLHISLLKESVKNHFNDGEFIGYSPVFTCFENHPIAIHSIALTSYPALTYQHLNKELFFMSLQEEKKEQESEEYAEKSDTKTLAESAVERAFTAGKLLEFQRSWALAFAESNLDRFNEEIEKMPAHAPIKLSQIALNFNAPPSKEVKRFEHMPIVKIAQLSGLSEEQLTTLLEGECLHV